MPFIENIKKYKSVATIGLEKNVGKTETLNYILKRLEKSRVKIAITSIGIDGEQIDQVTETSKPEIHIYEKMIFSTSEKYYFKKNFTSEILNTTTKRTALGKIIVAQALNDGEVILSGPPNGEWMKEIIEEMLKNGANLVIVDGALSRLSVGSPIITEGIILSTGAAVSLKKEEIIKKTVHYIELINLPTVSEDKKERLKTLDKGVYRILNEKIKKLPITSLLEFHKLEENIFSEKCEMFISGALTEKFIKNLNTQKKLENCKIIVTDFTKIFVSPEILKIFYKKGGKIEVLYKTNLVAITVNPFSPTGIYLNSDEIVNELKKHTHVPVVDVRKV